VKNRRAHSLTVRRFIAGLMAATIGGFGSLAVATASQANISCDLTVTSYSVTTDPYGNPLGPYWVYASITNTAPVTSTGWVVYIDLPTNYLNFIDFDADPMSEYGSGWYRALDRNRAIPPGQSTQLRFLMTMNSGAAFNTPTQNFCSLF
jgi:hypothetical protein